MGLYSAAEAAGNVEIIELCADDDTTTQYTQFKSLIDQGVDVIVCCAIDQDAILTAYDYAQAAGVPVINYDRKVEHENVFFTAMYDSYSDAKQLAEYLLSVDDGEEHTIFLTVGSLADPNGIARREGFQETIAASGHTNLKVVEIMTDWDVDKALTNMQNALQVYTRGRLPTSPRTWTAPATRRWRRPASRLNAARKAMSTTPRSPASLPQSPTWKRATPTRSSSSRPTPGPAAAMLRRGRQALVNGRKPLKLRHLPYMPTFGVGPARARGEVRRDLDRQVCRHAGIISPQTQDAPPCKLSAQRCGGFAAGSAAADPPFPEGSSHNPRTLR